MHLHKDFNPSIQTSETSLIALPSWMIWIELYRTASIPNSFLDCRCCRVLWITTTGLWWSWSWSFSYQVNQYRLKFFLTVIPSFPWFGQLHRLKDGYQISLLQPTLPRILIPNWLFKNRNCKIVDEQITLKQITINLQQIQLILIRILVKNDINNVGD